MIESGVCRVGQGSDGWNMLVDGTYVPDAGLAPGANTSALPTCARPYQVLEPTRLRVEPLEFAATSEAVPAGALAWVRCESPGTAPGPAAYWHRVEGGGWISGTFLARPDPSTGAAGVPVCAGSAETPSGAPEAAAAPAPPQRINAPASRHLY